MTDTLHSGELAAALEGTIFAGKVQVFATLDSTNTYAMLEAATGAPEGSVYVAEEQTAGRGRGAHAWHSEPHSGLYLSILLRPEMTPADALWLSLASGLAVQQTVQNVTGLVADVRWPNDLLLGARKFGGILTETSGESNRIRCAVVGIGINVGHRQFPHELREVATSLRMESDRIVSRQDLLIELLQTLSSELRMLTRKQSFSEATGSILKRMGQKSSWIRGKRVVVEEAEGYTGVTAGLDARGFLLVQTSGGMRTVLSGGVREDKMTPAAGNLNVISH